MYARNEQNMLYWEGNMIDNTNQIRILVEYLVDEYVDMVISSLILSAESQLIDTYFSDSEPINTGDHLNYYVGMHDVLSCISTTLEPTMISKSLM